MKGLVYQAEEFGIYPGDYEGPWEIVEMAQLYFCFGNSVCTGLGCERKTEGRGTDEEVKREFREKGS